MTRSIHPVPAARLLMLGAVLAAATIACTAGADGSDISAAGAANPGGAGTVAAPSPAAAGDLDVAGIANDLRAAAARHDGPAEAAGRELLANRLGRAQLASLESTYRLLLADLEVAMVSHDAQGIARHRAEFETLCASGTLTGLLQDCDADLATVLR
jgi:hypothetical protein